MAVGRERTSEDQRRWGSWVSEVEHEPAGTQRGFEAAQFFYAQFNWRTVRIRTSSGAVTTLTSQFVIHKAILYSAGSLTMCIYFETSSLVEERVIIRTITERVRFFAVCSTSRSLTQSMSNGGQVNFYRE